MKKYFFLLIFLCQVLHGYSQKRSEQLKDTIVWNFNYRLVKDDFKGKPSKGSFYGMTVSGILLDPKEVNGTIKYYVSAVFFRPKSWLKTDSEYGLKHEQGHFDITEIYARKLRQKIGSKNLIRSKKLNAELNGLYKQVNSEWQKEQNRYDRETEHSIKTEKQELWNKKIESQLEELKEFADIEVNLKQP